MWENKVSSCKEMVKAKEERGVKPGCEERERKRETARTQEEEGVQWMEFVRKKENKDKEPRGNMKTKDACKIERNERRNEEILEEWWGAESEGGERYSETERLGKSKERNEQSTKRKVGWRKCKEEMKSTIHIILRKERLNYFTGWINELRIDGDKKTKKKKASRKEKSIVGVRKEVLYSWITKSLWSCRGTENNLGWMIYFSRRWKLSF